MSATSVRDTLHDISNRISEDMSEAEVETTFLNEDFFEELGYEGAGYDLRSKWSLPDNRRPDFATYSENQKAIAVYEFKEPEEELEDHRDQVEDYSNTLRANYAILTNGKELCILQRNRNNHTKVGDPISLGEADEEDGQKMVTLLSKPEWDITDINIIREYFNSLEPINLESELGREDFFKTFQLQEDSVFGEFVDSARDLLVELRDDQENPFVTGAYQFWDSSYSPTPSSLPSSWEPFFDESNICDIDEEDLKSFMFCLETGHALLSRLLLEKAVEDYDFFPSHMDIGLDKYFDELSGFDGTINVDGYPALTTGFIEDMKEILIESLFEDDIYVWWKEGYPDQLETLHQNPRSRFESIAADENGSETQMIAARERFSRAIADILFSVRKFDFAGVEGDPLGNLYQRYFDRKTRKALGEFYTPQSVVEYILDDVSYKPQGRSIHESKILDPACGSGTFTVEAINRYLDDVERFEDNPDWERHLRELCINPQIVGLDVHPFAVLMAQIRFTVAILPKYREAKMANDDFTIHRLPIFRTDSLENEREGADIAIDASGGANWTFSAVEDDDDLSIEVELPYEPENSDEELSVNIELPVQENVEEKCDVQNEEEYFAVLQGILDVVKEHMDFYRGEGGRDQDWEYRGGVAQSIEQYIIRDADIESEFFESYVETMLQKVQLLDQEYGDGRLFKIFEDKVLGIVVKNFIKYDFVVGNPPYIRKGNLSDNQTVYFNKLYESTSGNYDIYCLFIERGLDWLKNDGQLGYITPNQLLLAEYGESTEEKEGIRKNILKRANIEKVFDFRDTEVFEDAANLPVIIHLKSEDEEEARNLNEVRCIRVKSNIDDDTDSVDDSIIQLARKEENNPGYSDEYIDVFDYPQGELDERFWTFIPPEEKAVFEKLDQNSDNKLKELTDDGERIFSGTQTSRNTVFVVVPQNAHMIRPEDSGDVVEVVPTGGGEPVPLETDLLRPWLQGDDVKRWQGEWSGQHVIFPYQKPEVSEEYELLGKDDLEELDHTWDYLKSYESDLRGRESGRWENSDQWWEYGRPQNLEKLPHPKLISRDMSETSRFMLDDEGIWYYKTPYGTQFIPRYQEKTVEFACELNSKALEFYLKHIATMLLSGKYRYQTRFLKELPVVVPEDKNLIDSVENVKEIVGALDKRNKAKRFPESYLEEFSGSKDILEYEWSTDRRPVEERMTNIQERADRTYKIEIGNSDEIVSRYMDAKTRARYVYGAVVNRRVYSGDKSEIPIPQDDEEVERLVNEWQNDRSFYDEVESRRPELEAEINQEVYRLFDLDEEDQEIIESFCDSL